MSEEVSCHLSLAPEVDGEGDGVEAHLGEDQRQVGHGEDDDQAEI